MNVVEMPYADRMALSPMPKRGGRRERERRAIGCACVGREERIVQVEDERQGELFEAVSR
jgi:hypothetical protein